MKEKTDPNLIKKLTTPVDSLPFKKPSRVALAKNNITTIADLLAIDHPMSLKSVSYSSITDIYKVRQKYRTTHLMPYTDDQIKQAIEQLPKKDPPPQKTAPTSSKPKPKPSPHNPFVAYLNRYTTVSADHEAAFDEFITNIAPPSGTPLRLKTKIESFLKTCFNSPHPPSIILTGNAGDGKTYLCRQIIQAFTNTPISTWQTHTDWSIAHQGLTLRVVKDLSEITETAGGTILSELNQELTITHSKTIFLIAANEGRLRAILQQQALNTLYQTVDHQLNNGPNLDDKQLIVFNLNQVSTATYVSQALMWLTDAVHWQACNSCPALNACPIRFNAARLAIAPSNQRLSLLYQILEHLAHHITIRDMLIHLAYTLTAGLSCKKVINEHKRKRWKPHHYVYYQNTWGEYTDNTFRRKITVINLLRHLNVGDDSLFELDNFIINGANNNKSQQVEYDRLFAPALDLNKGRFAQDRDTYLRRGSPPLNNQKPDDLLKWLPSMRRKLFFEWQDTSKASQLFPFKFLQDYLKLLNNDENTLRRYQKELILGLNRTFSGLFINNNQKLYVTSQYASTNENTVPLIKVEIPADNIKLSLNHPPNIALDQPQATLHLEIASPPFVTAGSVFWELNLLRFEYLMRRARGGTANILAAECELSLRHLKDTLLAQFRMDENKTQEVKFFAVGANGYTLQTLWIDSDTKKIETRG